MKLSASLCAMPLWLSAAGLSPAAVGAGSVIFCDSTAQGASGRMFVCELDVAAPARLRFTANFSGGHDDTTASLKVTLNGVPLQCDEGSKTSLVGEDGDVSLECKVSLAGPAPSRRSLGVALKWNHAEYVNAELRSD